MADFFPGEFDVGGAVHKIGSLTRKLLDESMSLCFHHKKSNADSVIDGQYIVVLKDDTNVHDFLGTQKLQTTRVYTHALAGFSCKLSRQELSKLQANSSVKYIEQDRRFSLCPKEKPIARWNFTDDQPKQIVPNGVSRIGGLLSKVGKIDGVDERVDVDVAVLDTGIDLNHPDLNVYRNVSFVKSNNGGDDDQGHGTHVAGTIAALDNGFGVVGVAPGARLWAVKVVDGSGSGTVGGAIAGVDFVAQHADEIEILNMSLGLRGKSQAWEDAVTKTDQAGVTNIAAAGNNHEPTYNMCPADNPVVLTVTAFGDSNGRGGGGKETSCLGDPDDVFAEFSNYDPKNIETTPNTNVDICAPGICIVSTQMGGSYESRSGTSMAAPHATGAAALYKAKHPQATPAQVRDALIKAGKEQRDPGWGLSGDPDSAHEHVLFVGDF